MYLETIFEGAQTVQSHAEEEHGLLAWNAVGSTQWVLGGSSEVRHSCMLNSLQAFSGS